MKNLKSYRFLTMTALCIAGTLAVTKNAGQVFAEDYQGADAVLRQVAETNQSKTNENLTPTSQLRNDLKTFTQRSATLSPTDAAGQWLALLDRFSKLTETSANFFGQNSQDRPLDPRELVEAWPPPTDWPELAKEIEARPPGDEDHAAYETGLRLLAHTLTGDTASRQQDLASLEALAAKAKSNGANFYNSLFDQLSSSTIAMQDNPDAVLQTLENKLATQRSEGYGYYQENLQIPDLVSLVGPQKAEVFLRDALVKFKAQLQIDPETATDTLAQRLALELVGQLKVPQWSLVNTLDSVNLYEAMETRFGTQTNEVQITMPGLPAVALPEMTRDSYQNQSAKVYYLLGLIAKGRTSDAVQVAKQFDKESYVYFSNDVIGDMERAGFTSQLNSFFHDLLQQYPELPFWNEYIQLAALAEQTPEMVTLVKTTLSKPDLSKRQRIQLEQSLYQALLADDEVEAGVAELQRLLQTNEQASITMQMNLQQEDLGQLGLQLAQIGHLLNRPDWQEEGITDAEQSAREPNAPEWGGNTAISLARLLEDIHRGPEAESVLTLALSNAVVHQKNQGGSRVEYNEGSPIILAALARLYHDAGRDADVIELFDQAPYWGGKDLAKLDPNQLDLEEFNASFSHKHTTVPIGYYLASALARTGRPADAHKILDALFDQSPACDRLYELLLSLDDQQVPGELDALYARDQFETRPLIWKAHWLRTHQRLEEAEVAARKAISIDPTDGAEGPGDRLRAYAELAEIRAARGDTNEAATLRGVVAAVREAESADQFNTAGLLKRAVAMYQDSLTHFADAYCIHARLAILLSSLGQDRAAEEHYRRAYELMPDSFGRVESYCFGCQGAFQGEKAQNIAEKVFTQLAQTEPNKPQVHYLLGYLRDEEGRYSEALIDYRAAVKLDPDYLNAWVKIESLNQHVFLPAAERDAVVFNLLRLDPQNRHSSPSFETVSDLAALWNNVATANAKCPAKPESLYSLSASKAEIEKQSTQQNQRIEQMQMEEEIYSQESGKTVTPGGAIAQNPYIQAAQTLLTQEATLAMNE